MIELRGEGEELTVVSDIKQATPQRIFFSIPARARLVASLIGLDFVIAHRGFEWIDIGFHRADE
ncbi:MAG: hypothetical protein WA376_10935, partial [Terrimicrobiaceae bacterium]